MEAAAFLSVEKNLDTVDVSEFCDAPHRKVPESFRKRLDLRYFRVPLASGVGCAVYAAAQKIADAPAENLRAFSLPQNERPLILLLHGLGDDCVYPYWHWLEHFSKQGFQVLSVEWDGHGTVGSSHLDFQTATRSVPLLLQKIFSEPGRGVFSHLKTMPPVYLVGHSTGASLALIAATRPEVSKIIKAVIAVSPVLGRVPAVSYRNYEKWGYCNPMSWVRDFGGRVGAYGFQSLQAFSGLGAKELPVRLSLGLSLQEQASAFLHETFAERHILKNVCTEVVWIHGAKDRFSPYQTAKGLMEEIPMPLTTQIEAKRTHLSLAFSAVAPKYIAQFIQNQLAAKVVD